MEVDIYSGTDVTPSEIDGAQANASGRELDLFKLVLLIRKNLWRIFFFSVAGFLVGLMMALTTKPTYTSTAALLVPQTNPGANSLAMQLAGGLDLGGGGSYQVYEDILRSRTVADRLIEQYQLKQVYGTKEMLPTRLILAKRTLIMSSKEGLLRVTVEDTDPKRAADLANSYLSYVDRLNQDLAITSAGQQRAFFEREMIKEKNALADAEVDLKQTQELTGILVPQNQAVASLNAEENTRAQIRIRQVQLDALLQGATDQNPDVIRLRAEIAGLQTQLQAMRGKGGSDITGLPASKSPEIALENLRKAREVKFHETLFEMLSHQYETAKQNEAKTVSMIEVLDKALPAERKSWPPRALFCLLGMIGGGIAGIFFVIVQGFFAKVISHPENRRKYQEVLGKEPMTY
jgi:tyrosine-protein kinase Etk/Wzc